ncbi:hypothetical protein [Bradyrhizobium sp. USDA 4520]
MTNEELMDLLKERNALIVHCSRPGKGDVGVDGLLFPADLHNAIHICANESRELSCSLVWPEHVKTFGAIGIVLKPRSVASITTISPHDSGTHFDALGKREGGGVPFSAEAVDETFANSADYNEWTVTDADTMGIFVNLSEPLEVAKVFDLSADPNYDAELMGPAPAVVAAGPISLQEVIAAFPGLRLYAYHQGGMVEISNGANGLYTRPVSATDIYEVT